MASAPEDFSPLDLTAATKFMVICGTEPIAEGSLGFPIEIEHDPDFGFSIEFRQQVYRDGRYAGLMVYRFAELESFSMLGETLTIYIKEDRERDEIEL